MQHFHLFTLTGPGVTTMPWRCLVGATMSRLLVLPLAGTAMVVTARHFGIGASLPPMALMGGCSF